MCRFSLLFSFTVSIKLLYSSQWPQSRVCHYKVFQLSIQYTQLEYIFQPSETLYFCLILQWLCSVFILTFILNDSTTFIFLTGNPVLVTRQQSYSQLNVEQWSLILLEKTTSICRELYFVVPMCQRTFEMKYLNSSAGWTRTNIRLYCKQLCIP